MTVESLRENDLASSEGRFDSRIGEFFPLDAFETWSNGRKGVGAMGACKPADTSPRDPSIISSTAANST